MLSQGGDGSQQHHPAAAWLHAALQEACQCGLAPAQLRPCNDGAARNISAGNRSKLMSCLQCRALHSKLYSPA
jgi:hypothetical protein